ncbi:TPR-like protein [Dioscorea alata]|uniref:TPR-like protein n=1 Tax=Dioscorea alata TaxID=55571 RepID=A0ACB7UJT3_DIOAL|nr:TPR-like protein [Dioscorea alata]
MRLYTALLKCCSTRRSLLQIHGHLILTGLHKDLLHATMLIESYANVGCISASRHIFDAFFPMLADSFMWSTMIKCYATSNLFQESISLFHAMQYHHPQLTSFVFSPVLKACSGLHNVTMGKKVHGLIVKSGFEYDVVLATSLLQMYANVGCLDDACSVFDEMPVKDVVSWSSLMSGYMQCGDIDMGLEIFSIMALEKVDIDIVVLMKVAEACACLGALNQLKSVHGCFIKRWTDIDTNTDRRKMDNCLILMYSKCGDFLVAEKLFYRASGKDVVSWTCMISGFNQRSCYREALETFIQMQGYGIKLNAVTMMNVLHSCTRMGYLREGQSIHCFMIKRCVDSDMDCVAPALVNMYGSFNELKLCQNVFETAKEKTILSWNSLIATYAQNCSSRKALEVFVMMRTEGFFPDSFTLSSTLPACGHIGDLCAGAQIHGYIIRAGFHPSDFVRNSLIDMYSKCGSTDKAYKIFAELESKDIVTWNVMISGYVQNGKSEEAIALYYQIHRQCLKEDHVTFLTAIQACSHLGSLTKGRWIHHKIIMSGEATNTYLDSALINMYAKCGDLGMAQRVFNNLQEKNVVSWSSIIAAYGGHGQIEDAVLLFSQMVKSGTRPNEITFMSILSACSHAGLVKEGLQYYDLMREFQIVPQLQHSACIVDLLSRSGYVDRAFDLIKSMQIEPNASLWRTLLNGCYIHQRLDTAEAIQKRFLKNPKL